MDSTIELTIPQNKEKEPEFWFICTGDGRVSICSKAASDFGIIVGKSSGTNVIDFPDKADFEDIIRLGQRGAGASALLEAVPETGYSLAHVRNIRLFSTAVTEVCLYRNKSEYLASNDGTNERIGRMLDHVSHSTSRAGKKLQEIIDTEDMPYAVKDRLIHIVKMIDQISVDESFISSNFTKSEEDTSGIFDASVLFDHIAVCFKEMELSPFNVTFLNQTNGTSAMCFCDTDRFTGIVLMTAAVTARLSKSKSCKMILSSDGDTVIIEARCTPNSSFDFVKRSCDYSRLYRYLTVNPVELMTLEHLTSVPGIETDFENSNKNGFVIHVMFNSNTDPDRLKFRDSLAGTDVSINKYLKYLSGVFSSES